MLVTRFLSKCFRINLGQAESAAAPRLQAALHLQIIRQHQRSLLAPDRPKSRSLGICINMSTYIFLKTLRQFLPIVFFPNFDLSWFPASFLIVQNLCNICCDKQQYKNLYHLRPSKIYSYVNHIS